MGNSNKQISWYHLGLPILFQYYCILCLWLSTVCTGCNKQVVMVIMDWQSRLQEKEIYIALLGTFIDFVTTAQIIRVHANHVTGLVIYPYCINSQCHSHGVSCPQRENSSVLIAKLWFFKECDSSWKSKQTFSAAWHQLTLELFSQFVMWKSALISIWGAQCKSYAGVLQGTGFALMIASVFIKNHCLMTKHQLMALNHRHRLGAAAWAPMFSSVIAAFLPIFFCPQYFGCLQYFRQVFAIVVNNCASSMTCSIKVICSEHL